MRVPKVVVAVFAVLAISLITLNLALVMQSRRLAALNKAYEANLHLNIGVQVPPLSGFAADGRSLIVTFRGEPKTLLLVYARSCPDCGLNWPSWQELLDQVDPARVRAVAVSTEGAGLSKQYIEQVGLAKAETALLPDFQSIVSYRFRYTPQTILVGPDSRVEGIWSGVLSPRQITEIREQALSHESTLLNGDKGTQSK